MYVKIICYVSLVYALLFITSLPSIIFPWVCFFVSCQHWSCLSVNQISCFIHHHLISESSPQFTPPKLEISSFLKKSVLEVPRKNLKTFGERSSSNAAPEVWNKLPEYIKSSQSTAIFNPLITDCLYMPHQ